VSALPDAEGDGVIAWNTSNHAVAKISSIGHATAMGAGTANIEATIGTIEAIPWKVTVRAAGAPVALAALVPATQANLVSAQSALAIQVSGPVPAAPGTPVRDDFLGPLWRSITPAGGSTSISNGHLFIGVPGGANHDPLLPSNQAVRVVQAIGNDNFDVFIKIDSPLVASDGGTSQGLMVLSDDKDFSTFALATDGTNIHLVVETVTGGVGTKVFDDSDFSQYQNPMYLRLARTGSAYVTFYSVDGANWVPVARFVDTKIPTSIGPFASNYNETPSKAFPVVMSVNWFHVQ
jgi:hypothetical protein